MSDLPKVAILFLTYKRTQEAIRTLDSTFKNLNYPKELIGIYVADDGSSKEHMDSIFEIIERHEINLIGFHNEKIRLPGQEDTYNSGKGWNKGLGICHQFSDFVIVLEDDWLLDDPLDLAPYVNLLQEVESVGIITFRILSIGADVHTVGYDGRIYLQYKGITQYDYSGNPYLRHARYTRHYGWFIEDGSPGEIELKMDDSYHYDLLGPRIWRPFNLNQWGGWKHTGTHKTWE